MSEKKNATRPGEESATKTQATDKPLDKEIHDLISDAVGPLWEQLQVETAIVIAKVPNTDKMAIHYRGHFFDIAALLAKTSNKFNSQVDRELGR